jgi:hypothetical protein
MSSQTYSAVGSAAAMRWSAARTPSHVSHHAAQKHTTSNPPRRGAESLCMS